MYKNGLFKGERVHNKLLVDSIARRTGLPKTLIRIFLKAFTEEILDRLAADHIVSITNLGQLRVRERASRQVRPPNAEASTVIPPRKYVKFIAFKALKDRISE